MREQEIRPEALLDRYRELSALDAEICFADVSREPVPCAGCGGVEASFEFEKLGFAYQRCNTCGTLFQSPRPSLAAFEDFYRQSASARYWADVFFPAVAEIRREKIFRPRADRLAVLCASRGLGVERLMDVGAGFGIFLDEWRRRSPATTLIAVEPSESLAQECRAKGFEVIEDIVENVKGYEETADLVTCFEVLEHVHDTESFVRVLTSLARPGGHVFISTLGIDGFDLQMLWQRSGQISPPHHINFLSVKGFESLFRRAGLVDIEVSTPGQLDVDIVRNAVRRQPDLLEGQRFLSTVLRDDAAAAAFQTFLCEQRMSSHVWVIGRKPLGGESPS
jgi:SAM-dependent methyltransferase